MTAPLESAALELGAQRERERTTRALKSVPLGIMFGERWYRRDLVEAALAATEPEAETRTDG